MNAGKAAAGPDCPRCAAAPAYITRALSPKRKPRKTRRRPRKRRCAHCRAPFLPTARGRPRLYCSDACKVAAYRERLGPKQRGLISLHEADARLLLSELPAESFDLILTDPPYHFERSGGTYFRKWFEELGDEEWPAIFAQLYRVLKPDRCAYVFCDGRARRIFDAAAEEAGFRLRTPLIWDKEWIGLGGAWRAQYESICWYEKGEPLGPSIKNWSNIRRHPRVRGYPTEKPVALLRDLVSQSSAPGWSVLDPFCGSGNVGRAAAQLGRPSLLCDVDAATAESRLRVKAFRNEIAG
jgi:site-specific DNA-methyltransferase (adenine-specific)